MKNYSKNEFELDTGRIYSDMCRKWESIPRILFRQSEQAIQEILDNENVISFKWNGDEPYFNGKIKSLDERIRKINDFISQGEISTIGQITPIPFTSYYIKYRDEGYDIVDYSEPFILETEKHKEYFDLFFCCNLMVLDVMSHLEYLKYQFEHSFENDLKFYLEFLYSLSIKYGGFFSNNFFEKSIQNFERSISKAHPSSNAQKSNLDGPETALLQTLAVYYLIQEIQSNTHRTQAAKVRFIKMLIGKNETTIKDYLGNPLDNKKPETTRKVLALLISYFEDLKLNNIVDAINKDLHTISISNKM